MRSLIVLLVLAATPATPPTLEQRKRFAEQHRSKFTFDWKRADDQCVKVVAPAALGCDTPVWLCPRSWSSGMCDGSFSESRGVSFSSDARPAAGPLPELTLESEAGADCPECDCTGDVGMGFGPGMTKAQQDAARRELAQERARQHDACVREAAKRQQAERVKRKCTLLMVDPCRQEAFLRCSGKNGSEYDPPLDKTLVFSFALGADGGAPAGGEWEVREGE